MKLEEMSPDEILQEIEARGDELTHAEAEHATIETDFKAWEATRQLAYRDSKMSMAEAEKRVRAEDGWSDKYFELQVSHVNVADKKRRHRRAEHALELFRTVQATIRAIER